MTRATVHVDLAHKYCVIVSGDTQHGQWSGITRRTVQSAIARDGWMFTPGSEWTLTTDGGSREVFQHPVKVDDRLLDRLGAAKPAEQTALIEDELCALLLAWRHEADAEPHGELVDTDIALTAIALGRAA